MAPAYKKVKLDNNKHKDGAMETAKIKISETSAEVTARKKSNSNVDIRNVRRGRILNFKNRKHYFTIFFQKINFSQRILSEMF